VKTIWKFPIPMQETVVLTMPAGAQALDVQLQGDVPMLWALVEADAPRERRRFFIAGTGRVMRDEAGAHLGTWQQDGYVWHLFDGGAT